MLANFYFVAFFSFGDVTEDSVFHNVHVEKFLSSSVPVGAFSKAIYARQAPLHNGNDGLTHFFGMFFHRVVNQVPAL